jgi:membrane-bound lytic murein transglycosylase D
MIFLKLVFVIGLIASPSLSVAQTDRFQKLGVMLDPWSEAQINFWRDVYTNYTTKDYVVHDSVDLAHVYGVVKSDQEASAKKAEIRRSLLRMVAEAKKTGVVDAANLNADEKKLFEIFDQDTDPEAYQFAADPERFRTQLGQKDRLENAYTVSRHYLTRMEEMLTEEGVPKELSRLPFVESSFNQNARSSVGAIGIWQFMPKTAMRDLRVDSAIDERYDPLKSTRAAAKFLMRNESILKNWGLAIMAYNQGAGLEQKAIKRLGTHDPVQIIRVFKDPQFHFASRNYLFEFLAMVDVDAKHDLFFKKEAELKLPAFITVSFPTRLKMETILAHYHVKEAETRLLNPHFLAPIWKGTATIPAHYPVRLTGITLEEFRDLQYPKNQ